MKEMFSERLEFLQNNFYSYGEYAWLEQRAIAMKEKIRSNILKAAQPGNRAPAGFFGDGEKARYQKFTGMIFVENETKDVLCFFMLQ